MARASGKQVTLYLEPWQQRMVSDLTSKRLRAGLGRRDLRRLILSKGRIFCPASYRISPHGLRKDDYELYLTNEQMLAVKHEFGKFGDVLAKVKRQLDTAGRTIEETGVRTRAMERKLRSVEALPSDAATDILELAQEGPVDLHEAAKEDGAA